MPAVPESIPEFPTAPEHTVKMSLGPSPRDAASRRQNNFAFVRLFLAVLVLVSHSPEMIDGNQDREILVRLFHGWSFGAIAVAGFFLLSGYLILQSWESTPRLGPYLAKRGRRIFPGFVAASFLCAFLVGPLGSAARSYFARFQWPDFLTGVLLLKPPVIPPVFAGTPYPLVNGSMWTIEYEARCYLLVAALGLCGVIRHRWMWLATTVLVMVISQNDAMADWIAFPGVRHVLLGRASFFRFLSFFCVGGCFYLWRGRISYARPWILAAVGAGVLAAAAPMPTRPVLTVLGGYLLFAFVFARVPGLAWFKTTSDISYGVYLCGWPTQKLIHWYFPALSPWWLLALTIPVCFAYGLISWQFIEKPFLRPKSRERDSILALSQNV
jgi:peptidoglycan/LPS O-acetylase OafA/YrhL